MTPDTKNPTVKVVLDTNIIVSALVFGGKPRQALELVIQRKIISVISPFLLSELLEVLVKKFKFSSKKAQLAERKIKKLFETVYPTKIIKVLKDEGDNQVLETAQTGNVSFIITGDKELLELGVFENIKIIKADKFLSLL